MTTERLFAAHPARSHTTPAYSTRRRSFVFLGVPGTTREWAEDGLAVLAGLVLVAEGVALLWMVVGR